MSNQPTQPRRRGPSWQNDVDVNAIPVQVVGQGWYQQFTNLAAARVVFPTLDPKVNNKDFTWAMRGEVAGQPALRFETWKVYRELSQD